MLAGSRDLRPGLQGGRRGCGSRDSPLSTQVKETASMRPVVFSIFALLLCAAILQLGNGLQFTLIPIRAQAEQFGDMAIATLGTGYFAGFLLGCIIGAPLIGRLGHVRVLTAVLAALCALALLYPLVIDETFWMLARILTGTSLAIAIWPLKAGLMNAPLIISGGRFCRFIPLWEW